MQATPPPVLVASYFDGINARAQPVTLQVQGDVLRLTGEGIDLALDLHAVSWPERTRHGVRVAHFKGGGCVQSGDAAAWDAWSRSSGQHEPLLVRMQQSWRWVIASVLVLAALALLLQQSGLPALSRAVVAATPLSVDVSLGQASLALLDEHVMRPSKLAATEQARLRAALTQALAASPAASVPAWELVFRDSRVGPNALALPGGTLVMTDQLVELVGRDEQVTTAVLAHELGHLRYRHGLRMLVQVTVLGGLSALVLGDFSSLLAGAPVLLGQASYSRQAEREADTEAVRLLKAARISPAVMLTLFDKLAEKRAEGGQSEDRPAQADSWLGVAFASHPADADRVRYFREAAAH